MPIAQRTPLARPAPQDGSSPAGARARTSTATVDSPLGPLTLSAAGGALTRVALADPGSAQEGLPAHGDPSTPAGSRTLRDLGDGARPEVAADDTVLAEAAAQLSAYFAGERMTFTLPLRPEGTAFQQTVWAALQEIPYGETVSYGQLARRLGTPGASRAVGRANGRNPLMVIVPCHRVVAAGGGLGGYAGGLDRKRLLLDLESAGADARLF